MIRRALLEDVEALLSIQSCWRALPQWTLEHFRHEIGSPRSHLCVAMEGLEIAGYAAMLMVVPEAQILMVAVASDRTRKGHGKALISHLKEFARAAGCEKATLEVSGGNEAALALYRSSGFVAAGRRTKFYADGSDAVLMDAAI